MLDDADPGLRTVRTDRHPREDFDAIVDGVLEDVLAAVAELRAGRARAAPVDVLLQRQGLRVSHDLPLRGGVA